jgi:hypothetical protein
LINNTGKLTNDDKEMSEVLNKYFASVFTVEDVNNVPMAEMRENGRQPMQELQLEAIDITSEKVYEALKKLKPNKTGGVDGLNSSFILGVAEAIVEPLRIIYTKTLSSGIVPRDSKNANVTAIFKKG